MAIGTPARVGSIGTASGTSLTITTAGAIATHDIVAVAHYAASTGVTIATIADDSANVYNRIYLSSAASAPVLEVYLVTDAIAMTSAHSITVTFNGAAVRHGLYAVNVAGMVNAAGVFDPHTPAAFDRTTGTSSSVAIGNSASTTELLLSFTVAGATLGTFTPGGSFAALTALTSNAFMYPMYQILAANTPTTAAPSWVNSVSHFTAGFGFLGLPATNTSREAQGTLVGVGV